MLFGMPLVLGELVVGSCRSANESTGLVGFDGFDTDGGGYGNPVPSMLKLGLDADRNRL